jgi:predicted amidohydrolase
MKTKGVNRRRFLQYLATSMAMGVAGLADAKTCRIRAAAIQMTPRLGDVEANLAQAAQLIDEAIRHGAEWIMLREMFTSAAAFHGEMITAIRPIDGAPARLLRDKATGHHVAIGGSFLAQGGGTR